MKEAVSCQPSAISDQPRNGAKVQDFRKLKVWEKAHELALAVYRATARFPKEELYGLTSQIRRARMSVPMNIAEGCGRGTEADFAHFLHIAMGSACEAEYQLLLSHDLGYLPQDQYSMLQICLEEVKRMISSPLRTLRAASKKLTAES